MALSTILEWLFTHLCCFDLFSQDKKGVANTRMERFFDEDRFEIYATRKSMILSMLCVPRKVAKPMLAFRGAPCLRCLRCDPMATVDAAAAAAATGQPQQSFFSHMSVMHC